MARYVRCINWEKHQGDKRRPTNPWIKVYRKMLDNRRYMELDDGSGRLLVLLWLLASEKDNAIPVMELGWRLRRDEAQVENELRTLVEAEFVEVFDA